MGTELKISQFCKNTWRRGIIRWKRALITPNKASPKGKILTIILSQAKSDNREEYSGVVTDEPFFRKRVGVNTDTHAYKQQTWSHKQHMYSSFLCVPNFPFCSETTSSRQNGFLSSLYHQPVTYLLTFLQIAWMPEHMELLLSFYSCDKTAVAGE